jgi:hypothetical protein
MSVGKDRIAKDDTKIFATLGLIVLPAVALKALFPQYLFSHHLVRIAMVFAGGLIQFQYPEALSFLCNYRRPRFLGSVPPSTIKLFGTVFIVASGVYLFVEIVLSI